MEYHNQLGSHHFQQQQQQQSQQPQYSNIMGNSNGMLAAAPGGQQSQFGLLPDGSSSSEKALMWSTTGQYMSDSGFSTQAPSVCSHDSSAAYMNSTRPSHNQFQQPPAANMQQMQQQQQQQQQQQPILPDSTMGHQQQQQQQAMSSAAEQKQAAEETDDDNNVVNWINSQDNLEMALKAVPDLLKLLLDEDVVVVQQSAEILNRMSRRDTPRQALILTTDIVPCIVNCLVNTSDLDTVRSLIGALYGISNQKPEGPKAICRSQAPTLLVASLAAPDKGIVDYSITTIHNILLDCGDVIKSQMRQAGAIHNLVTLLGTSQNVKFLSIVVECLYSFVHLNQEAKIFLLQMGGTQQLVGLLFNHTQQYPKLIHHIIRLLKVLSTCETNKKAMASMNAIQPLSSHLMAASSANSGAPNGSISRDITINCLHTLRNLSSAVTEQPGLAPFITGLLNFLSNTQEVNQIEIAAPILSNLTVNEANKTAAFNSNGIPILLKLISHYSGISKIVDPCMCTLRHLTIRHADMYAAQEQLRSFNGFGIIASVMRQTPRHWGVAKAVLGVVRNLAANPAYSELMRQLDMISNLMTILFEAFNIIQHKTNNGQTPNINVKLDETNLYEIVDTSMASLLILAKDPVNKIIMRNLDCIGFFLQMFYSPQVAIRRPAASILAELASSRECAIVIEQMPGFHEFVSTNFCNQFGQLLNVNQVAGNPDVLQIVSTLMQRLQEHRNKSIAFY